MKNWPCFLLAVVITCAYGADNEQPIQIEADNLTVEEAEGISTYSGNVSVNQGTLSLQADRVRIYTEGNAIVRIVASVPETADSLAHYRQSSDTEREQVEGQARKIVYHVRQERLEFVGEAMLSRAEETTVSGDTVNYDAAAGRVDASGGGRSRVKTTIRQDGSQN